MPKTLSDWHKKRISEANSGKNHWNWGNKYSIERRKKMSESFKARFIAGAVPWNYKAGISKDVEYKKQWKRDHPENIRASRKRAQERNRLSVLLKVGRGKVECVRCGCTERNILQINHKNFGGGKENRAFGGSKLYTYIRVGKREIDDLELLCRVCNNAHYAESISGIVYTIKWAKK